MAVLAAIGLGQAVADDTPPTRTHQLRFAPERSAWIELPRPEPGTAAGDLATARAALADQRYKKVRTLISAWQKNYGSSSEFFPQALLLDARAEKGLRNYYDAYQVLDRLISEFRATDAADDAVVELFNIAEVYLSGVRRKLWGMRLLNASELALDILDRITAEFAGTRLAELALKTKADYFFQRGDFALAELELARLLQEYPESQYHRYALKLSADAALASFTGIRFDDAPLVEAEERYRMYAREYPDDAATVAPILQTIRERRAEKELDVGRYYRKIEQLKAAVFYFESVQAHWPDTAAAAQALQAIKAMEGQAASGGDASETPVPPEDREEDEP